MESAITRIERAGERGVDTAKNVAYTLTNLIQNKPTIDKHPTLAKKWTFGERAADVLAGRMGSWGFLSFFLIFIAIWITINALALINRWDPYPFIMLNLVLSCIAAIQAPIILMSQNRQSQKDRIRMEYDYAVNRKSERQIEILKAQLDRIEDKLNKN